MSPIRSADTDALFDAILTLKNREDCYAFFEDVCTPKEVMDMAQRFAAAVLLDRGENYKQISEEVGVSTATISRVSRCLQYGTGYKSALARLNAKNDEK